MPETPCMASLPRTLSLGTESKDLLLAEKFIVLPAARVVFDIIRNADQFILAANNVILKTWLPSEFNMQFIGGRCY